MGEVTGGRAEKPRAGDDEKRGITENTGAREDGAGERVTGKSPPPPPYQGLTKIIYRRYIQGLEKLLKSQDLQQYFVPCFGLLVVVFISDYNTGEGALA